MTFRTWIEIEFEVEAEYHPEEKETRDCPGSNEETAVLSVTCVDPRVTIKNDACEINREVLGRSPAVAAAVAKLLETLEEEALEVVSDL